MSIEGEIKETVTRAIVDGLRAMEDRIVERVTRAVGSRKVSVAEAAEILGVSLTTAWRMVNEGELAHVRVGRRILIDVADLPSASKQDDEVDEAIAKTRARAGGRR